MLDSIATTFYFTSSLAQPSTDMGAVAVFMFVTSIKFILMAAARFGMLSTKTLLVGNCQFVGLFSS